MIKKNNAERAEENRKPEATPAMASFLKNPNTNTPETVKAAKQKSKAANEKKAAAQTPKKAVGRRSAAKKSEPKGNVAAAKAAGESAPRTPNRSTAAKNTKAAGKNTPARPNTRRVSKKNIQPEEKAVPIHIIPLGGLSEIGKNMTAYECQGDMLIVDCGMAFPDADMPGVDLVIPDFNFVEENIKKIRGVVITHGHEDHIGSIPYLLKKFDLPIYASPLAIGLIKGKLKEHGLLNKAKLHIVHPRQEVKMGCMTAEFIHVNHSIPDAMAIAIHSPAGIVVQTGDFKIDYSPVEGGVTDIARFAELGEEGVLCLLSDSTNAERPGTTASESKVGQSFQGLFSNAGGRRIIIASFSSNIHRIQQIITIAAQVGRKVAVSGRSMENVVSVAMELGYLTVPEGILIDIDTISSYPPEQVIIITTGSQGEPMSALSRMASGEHRKVSVTSNDFIIISATPIPGNEKHVTRVVNDLLKLGAVVVYEAMYEVHVSGHACQDEQKLMLSLTKPKYFLPVHGEYKHLKAHERSAISVGVPKENIHIGENGEVIEVSQDRMEVVSKVEAGAVLVDGLGVGDVGTIVLRDRQRLAQDGLIIVVITMESVSGAILAGPDIVSRGFVYVREAEELLTEAKQVVKNILAKCGEENVRDWSSIKLSVRDGLSGYIFKKTRRSPMILPIITEV